MNGYIDMHCHILPEVDDGASDLSVTRKMLEIAYKEGIRAIIATPHFHPYRGHASKEYLKEQLRLVRAEAEKIDPKFRIFLGNEIYYGHDIPALLREKKILTMNNREYVLVEFSASERLEHMRQAIQTLQAEGFCVILAHAERYECILENVYAAEDIYDMGALIQVNAGSILGKNGRKIKKLTHVLLNNQMVFGVGTDAHGIKERPPEMEKAVQYVIKKYGEDYAKKIFFSNAAQLLRKKK